MSITIEEFIGTRVEYDKMGTFIWGLNEKGEMQMIADVRGWGAIQHLFKDKQEAANFQDDLGDWIVDAINKKIQRSNMSNAIPCDYNRHNCVYGSACKYPNCDT